MKAYIYMRWTPKENTSNDYYGLKPNVVYRCIRTASGQQYKGLDSNECWLLEGFEQLSNVDVLCQIYTGKIIPEDLP